MKKDELFKIAKPLIFAPYEVETLLSGCKLQKLEYVKYKNSNIIDVPKYSLESGEPYDFQIVQRTAEGRVIKCVRIEPEHRIGDVFYVMETFFNIRNKGDVVYYYRADATPEIEKIRLDNKKVWRPSRQMPSAAARLFVRVSEQHAEKRAHPMGAWMWSYGFEQIIPEDASISIEK